MKPSFPRLLQWLGVAVFLVAIVGLNYDFESEAGKVMNSTLNPEISSMQSTITYLGYAEISDSDGNQSQSVSVPSSTDFALAFIGGWRSGANPSVTSISLGGTAMTSVGSSISNANGAAYMYYVNTTPGSKTFASTQSNSWTEGGKAVLLFFSGVHQSLPIRSSSALNNSGNATLSFNSMTSSSGDMAVIQMQGYSSTSVDVDLSAQTKIFENGSAFNSEYNAAAYKVATASTISLSGYGNYPGAVVAVLKPETLSEALEGLPVGHWTFDGNDIVWSDTSTEIKDVSGQGNHGNAVGLTTASVTRGKLGQGLSFNGTSDYVATGSTVNFGGAQIITVSFWLFMSAYVNDGSPVIALGDSLFTNGAFSLRPNGDTVFNAWEILTYDGGSRLETFERPSAGEWHHFSFILDNSTVAGDMRVFVDGSEVMTTLEWADKTTSGAFRTDTLNMMTQPSVGDYLAGKLDDVRIYNRALSTTEIMSLYDMGK